MNYVNDYIIKPKILELARTPFETGWDLGPFAAVLQCLHLDTPPLEQQKTKK